MPGQGFFAQVTQTTTALVTTYGATFLASGVMEFKGISMILVVWEGYKVAFRMESASRIAGLLVSILIIYGALMFYSAPFPGLGQNLTQIVTDAGTNFADQIDTSIEMQVGTQVSNMLGNASISAWNMVTDWAACVRYVLILFALSAIQIVMLGVIAFGFVAVGVIVLIGPILLPFMLVPHLDWLATGWFRALVQYSFYPVVGNAFVYVYGLVWINYFQQWSGPLDAQTIAALIFQIVVLSLAGVFGILQVPKLVAGIFNGTSGINAFPGFGWWR